MLAAGVQLALGAGALVMLLPFAVMVITALTPEDRVFDQSIPWDSLTLNNFRTAWQASPWLEYYRNGFLSVALTFLGQLFICLPAGYVLARKTFRANGAILALVVLCLLVPLQVKAIPTYVMLQQAGLLDTITALVLPFIGSAFMIFLYRQFILTIPQEVFDAAWIDGVGPLGILWRIVLPSVKPAIAAAAAFSIVEHWNDLFWPSLVVRSLASATVPYGIANLGGEDAGIRYGPVMAAACLAIAPLIAGFIFLQRHLVRGITVN